MGGSVDTRGGAFIGRDQVLYFDHVQVDQIVYQGVQPITAGALLDGCLSQVNNVLADARQKYNPELYVHRAIEDELNPFFDAPPDPSGKNCYLLVAPAGSGKTNLLCDLARQRIVHQPVVLLLSGNTYLSGDSGLLSALQSELETTSAGIAFRSAGDCLHTLHSLAEEMGTHALIFIDAINEHDQPAQMKKALADLLRKTRGKRIRVLITCRDYYWGLFKGPFWEDSTLNYLSYAGQDEGESMESFHVFGDTEQAQALPLYLDHYRITGRPVGEAAEQCRHPLLLLFFCEAYHGQDIGELENIRLKELFDLYWQRKLASIAERMVQQGDERLLDSLVAQVGAYLLAIAATMLHQNTRAIPLDQLSAASQFQEDPGNPRSLYGRIRDEFIILEQNERGKGPRREILVAFVYEEFMEYVMALALLDEWARAGLDDGAILDAVEDLTGSYSDFTQIIGVMVYLAIMLKEQRDLTLWSVLIDKGERWRGVIFEAMRKLPEDQLDAGIYQVLGELLAHPDETVLIQSLDTLKVNRIGRSIPSGMVTSLIMLIESGSEQVSRRAVVALGRTRSEQLLPGLETALKHRDLAVRYSAVNLLKSRPDLGTSLLVATLQDEFSGVRLKAAQALKERGWKPADRQGRAWYLAALQDWDGLAKLGPLAAEPLLLALKDKDNRVRAKAAETLGRIG